MLIKTGQMLIKWIKTGYLLHKFRKECINIQKSIKMSFSGCIRVASSPAPLIFRKGDSISGGNGSSQSPFLISSLSDYLQLAERVPMKLIIY
jgi:hypothetical protein